MSLPLIETKWTLLNLSASELLKRGNQHFSSKNYYSAKSCYTEALALNDGKSKQDQAALNSNLAACCLMLPGGSADAYSAAVAAFDLDVQSFRVKSCYRAARASMNLDKLN